MDIYLTIEGIKCAAEVGRNTAQIVHLLKQYVDYLRQVETVSNIQRKLAMVQEVLNQDVRNDELKYTRALVHLEAVYVELGGIMGGKLFGSRKIRHKMDQVSIEMAIIHKLLGDPADTIYEYAVEKTSLSKPVADHLERYEKQSYSKKYFLMSREQLEWLIGQDRYKEFIRGYDTRLEEMSNDTGSIYEPEDGCFGGYNYGD